MFFAFINVKATNNSIHIKDDKRKMLLNYVKLC